MAKVVKIDIITREIIKPSSPTLQHLRFMKLSLLDQLNFTMSTPILFFYPNKIQNIKQKSQLLKSSLSKTLTLFYPLAGKLKDHSFIHCNDHGVEFVDALVDCPMTDIFQNPDNFLLEKFISVDFNHTESSFRGAVIQANFFTCGGLAIGVSLSHKIADAASLATFLMAWTAASLAKETPHTVVPHFISDTIFPSPADSLTLPPPPPLLLTIETTTRRYVFDASNVSMLKAKAASATVQTPTRVEAITAFLWKCLMNLSGKKLSRFIKQSVLIQSVNLRPRFDPPMPENYIGNMSGKFLVETKDRNIELQGLVVLLRKGLEQVSNDGSRRILEFAKKFGELHGRDDVDMYSFTSLCGFPLYEVDFGWGKPMWATVTNLVLKNYVVLMDTRDGKGIEVCLSLSKEDVELLERNNQELLTFASVNPYLEACF
ncbi:vinorine synthase [Manihot esculenta]|uniref:vinorine synthase n=1 Tax=Manihot esculenta TaxID=3983 RepID=UPI000B5D3BD7|nr:vinorine synthase [Manihot esculenta]